MQYNTAYFAGVPIGNNHRKCKYDTLVISWLQQKIEEMSTISDCVPWIWIHKLKK